MAKRIPDHLKPFIDLIAKQALREDHLTPKPVNSVAPAAKRPHRVIPKRAGKG
jgi:hypothetical protein